MPGAAADLWRESVGLTGYTAKLTIWVIFGFILYKHALGKTMHVKMLQSGTASLYFWFVLFLV